MCPTLLSLLSLGFCVSLRIWAAVDEYDKPSLSAWPSPMVPLGETVTLQCHFRSPSKRSRLFKTDGASLTELHGNHFNTFTLGPVTREHAGSYTCSRFSRSLLVSSRHSDLLQIVVTGVFAKPSISAHPGPLLRVGENVTLRCNSPLLYDKFILHQENSTGNFQKRGEMLTGRHATADFSIGPVTLASGGTYRCYGSLRQSPYEWSAPSDPVDIIISGRSRKPSLSAQGGPVVRSGENVTLVCSSKSAFDQFHLLREEEDLGRPLAGGFTKSTCPSTMEPHTTEETKLPQEHCSMWYIILGLVIGFTSTSIILTALVCHWCCTANHVANMQGEPMEDRTVNSENSEAEDVIYAHLDLGTLSERRSTPAPLRPMHPSAETIIYEEFNINQDRAEP